LPWQSCHILTQLRMGFVGLNEYLSQIGVVTSPLCPKCHTPETVEHYLLQCRRFLTE
ncbi:hypothetical protein BU17DRAFT_48960, partial [Hysterangium stoloniferum]